MSARIALAAASVLLAIVAAAALAWAGGLSVRDLLAAIAGVPAWIFFLASAMSLAQVAISALKWRRVLAVSLPPRQLPDPSLALLLTAGAAVVAQVVPPYAATSLVRSLSARLAMRTPLATGALASVVEQGFDVLAFLLPASATVIVLALGAAGMPALWCALLAVAAGAAWALLGDAPLAAMRRRTGRAAKGRIGRLLARLPALDAGLRRRLLTLSLLRWGVMALRAALVAGAIGASFGAGDLLLGFSLVQASQLAAVTPANLGLAEWTWAGGLGYLGQGLGEIAVFALTLRAVSVVSYVAAFALCVLVHACARLGPAGQPVCGKERNGR